MSPMYAASVSDRVTEIEDSTSERHIETWLDGPHGWLNLQAAQAGYPARSKPGEGFPVRPLWTEYALYSDARMTGSDKIPGPLGVELAFARGPDRVGCVQLGSILRVTDHLLDQRHEPYVPAEKEDGSYVGGDIADEVASLMSLALSRRIRSGGVVRQCFSPDEPLGRPTMWNVAPHLAEPRHQPILPGIADQVLIDPARAYLEHYGRLGAADAVAVLRAAHQYADAIWWADADPRIAWFKLFGALEAAAGRWDACELRTPAEQLQRRHPGLHGRLVKHAPAAVEIVAESFSRVIGAENRLIEFVLTFEPGPPDVRPPYSRVAWDELKGVLSTLWGHRSADVHGGAPFPPPLCESPYEVEGVPAETFIGGSMSAGNSSWPASELPMHLHVFADLVARTLRAWWRSLPREDVFRRVDPPAE